MLLWNDRERAHAEDPAYTVLTNLQQTLVFIIQSKPIRI